MGSREKIAVLIKGILERKTGRQVEVKKVEAIANIFVKGLEIKGIMIVKDELEISQEELEREPKKLAGEMLSIFKKHGI